jgi:hypothetical protein
MSIIKRTTRRTSVIATALILALAGVAAFAYWTISGEGTGEAHVGSPTSNLRVESAPVEGLAPGVSKETKVTVLNVSAAESIRTVTLQATYTGNSHEGFGCNKAWFTVAPVSQPLAKELKPGESETANVTIAMVGAETENQNACKGATVYLHFIAQ